MLVMFLNFGLVPSTIYHLSAQKLTAHQWGVRCLRLFFALLGLGTAIGVTILSLGARSLFPGVDTSTLWLALLVFPVAFLAALLHAALQGLNMFRALNVAIIGQSILTLILVCALISLGRTELQLLVTANIAAQAATCVWLIRLLWPKFQTKPPTEPQPPPSDSLLAYGFRSHLGNVVAFFNYKTDIFIVNYYLGPSLTGVYTVAVSIAERLSLVPHSVGTVLFPRLSRLSAADEEQRRLTEVASRWTLVITGLAAIPFAFASGLLIIVVFGEAYSPAILPLILIIPGFVLASSSQVIANGIAARGRPDLNTVTAIFALAANVASSCLLTPLIGLQGAALSTTSALAINFALKLYVHTRLARSKWTSCVLLRREDLDALLSVVRARRGGRTASDSMTR
jgi:O-antigen/teichoic acid export membrane protein